MPRGTELEPIGLGEVLACAGLQDRQDVKYVVTSAVLDGLLGAVQATHRVLEIDGVRTFTYRTTYFDTCGLVSYRDHVQRRRRRFKCRTREYADTGLRTFEVKLKGARDRTVKHRLELDAALAGGLPEPARAFLEDRLREGYGRALAGDLGPTLAMTYRRLTLVEPERGERVTCDLDLRFVTPKGRGGQLAPGHAIIESKSTTGAGAADRELRRLGARPAAGCSKYCLGIGLTHPDVPSNAFRPLLRRYFEAA